MRTEIISVGYASVRTVRNKELYIRFLITKFQREETLVEREKLNLWMILDDLRMISTGGRNLTNFQIELIQMGFLEQLSCKNYNQKSEKIRLNYLIRKLVLPPHEYFGIKGTEKGLNFETLELKYVPVEKIFYPDAPYIGVGYKDKGGGGSDSDREYLYANQFHYLQNEKVCIPSVFGTLNSKSRAYVGNFLRQFGQKECVV